MNLLFLHYTISNRPLMTFIQFLPYSLMFHKIGRYFLTFTPKQHAVSILFQLWWLFPCLLIFKNHLAMVLFVSSVHKSIASIIFRNITIKSSFSVLQMLKHSFWKVYLIERFVYENNWSKSLKVFISGENLALY